jgi:hypothetical protein
MRKSIFAEFFYLCSAIIFAAVICIGAVLILVSIENFKIQQRNHLVKVSDEVTAITMVCCLSDDSFDTNRLFSAYNNAAKTYDTDFALVDSNGKAWCILRHHLALHIKAQRVFQGFSKQLIMTDISAWGLWGLLSKIMLYVHFPC